MKDRTKPDVEKGEPSARKDEGRTKRAVTYPLRQGACMRPKMPISVLSS